MTENKQLSAAWTKVRQALGAYAEREPRPLLIFTVYLMLQPIIDVITFLTVHADLPLTPGIFLRTVYLVYAAIYVFFIYKGKFKLPLRIYLLILGLYCLGFLVFHLLHREHTFASAFFIQIKGLVKVVYFPIMCALLFAFFDTWKRVIAKWTLPFVIMTYIAIILLAMLTGTSVKSYAFGEGYNGWFYAANEIGAIVACLAPVTLRFFNRGRSLIRLLPILLIAFIASYIGTKIVFFIILFYIILAVFWYAGFAISARLKSRELKPLQKFLRGGTVMLLTAVICLGVFAANSPLRMNMSGLRNSKPVITQPVKPQPNVQTNTARPEEVAKQHGKLWTIMNKISSNRLYYMEDYVNLAEHWTPADYLFGTGYEGLAEARTIEMDLFAFYYQNGALGFVILASPFFGMLFYSVFDAIRHFRRFITSVEACAALYSFGALSVTAFIAGHVLPAPAVSIYLPLLFVAYLEAMRKPRLSDSADSPNVYQLTGDDQTQNDRV